MISGTDWTVVVDQASGVAIILGARWKWLKKEDPKLVDQLPHEVVTSIA